MLAFALILLVAVLVGAFVSLRGTSTDPQVRAIQRLPAYSLIYPGAKLLARVETPSTIPHGGTRGAVTVQVFGVPIADGSDVSQVFAWYSQQLQSEGWQTDGDIEAWTAYGYSLTIDPFLVEYRRQSHGAPTPASWPTRYTPLYEVVIERTCRP